MTQPTNKKDTIPVYLVTVLQTDSTNNKSLMYIKTRSDLFTVHQNHIDVRGVVISKEQVEKLKTEKDRDFGGEHIQMLIPHHRWINTINISFNKIINI